MFFLVVEGGSFFQVGVTASADAKAVPQDQFNHLSLKAHVKRILIIVFLVIRY